MVKEECLKPKAGHWCQMSAVELVEKETISPCGGEGRSLKASHSRQVD